MEQRLLRPNDPDWPQGVQHTSPTPTRLFLRGQLPKTPGVAVVGTRRITPYGRACTELLVRELVRLGVPVVSGLALGIDGVAHETAVEGGGMTVAIIGGGIDDRSISPSSHAGLAKRILESGGAIMSEYPPGAPSLPHHFPERNRLIAALSRAVLVIEAPHKSGAMITAKLALDMGREVWAVPGAITQENSQGPNELIRNGATPINGPDDLAQALGFEVRNGGRQGRLFPMEDLPPPERAVAEKLATGIDTADALSRALQLSVTAVSGVLTALELKGLVRSVGGGRYTLYT
mgnify:CR=1 FL=1